MKKSDLDALNALVLELDSFQLIHRDLHHDNVTVRLQTEGGAHPPGWWYMKLPQSARVLITNVLEAQLREHIISIKATLRKDYGYEHDDFSPT
jgi:hypothetical protein